MRVEALLDGDAAQYGYLGRRLIEMRCDSCGDLLELLRVRSQMGDQECPFPTAHMVLRCAYCSAQIRIRVSGGGTVSADDCLRILTHETAPLRLAADRRNAIKD